MARPNRAGVSMRRVNVSQWDEVPGRRRRSASGAIDAEWQDLGRAAGSAGASVKRIRVAPGRRPTPAHEHFHEEETYVVLRGAGWYWLDGSRFAVSAGDVILQRAGDGAHTMLAGDDGLDVLAFGAEPPAPVTYLPRARVMRAGLHALDYDPDAPRPFDREPEDLPGEDAPRPATICAIDDVEAEHRSIGRTDMVRRRIGAHLGARTTGLQHVVVAGGAESWPPHCHSAEEELFVVLEGDGSVVLGDERVPVRRGSVVARPPGTGVAHTFIGPVEYLAWGLHDPNDMCWYPRSKKVSLRGLGIRFFVEPVDYWEGET